MSVRKSNNILSLNADESLTFFMDSARYYSFGDIRKHFVHMLTSVQEHPYVEQSEVMLNGFDNHIKNRLEPKKLVMVEDVELWNNTWLKNKYSH